MKSKHDKYWRVIHLLRIVLPGSRKREQARGDEFVSRLGKAFGSPRPGGEFIAFIHPTQEPDLRDLDRSLMKMISEACSG